MKQSGDARKLASLAIYVIRPLLNWGVRQLHGIATMRYWIVKGNPRENDLNVMLEKSVVDSWRTGKPPKKWLRGDRLFFWSSAPRLELVGLGELLGPTGELTEDNETIYEVRYLTNAVASPVKAADLRANAICRDANFLKPAVAQGVLEVPSAQAQAMYSLLRQANARLPHVWRDLAPTGEKRKAPTARILDRAAVVSSKKGQGFGDPQSNSVVERAAVKAVAEDYRRRGWTVRSVERDKCGYDLECHYNASWQFVEVKGIAGSTCAFFLTAGELATAKTKPDYLIIAVTNATTRPTLTRIRPNELQKQYRLDPIAFRVVPISRR